MENFNPSYTIYFNAAPSASKLKLKLTIEYIEKNEYNMDKYDLTYQWEVISGNSNIHKNHANPFINMNFRYDTTDMEGVIVVKNQLSIELIKHLVMPNEELSKICGDGDAEDYKKRIIYSLSLFWS